MTVNSEPTGLASKQVERVHINGQLDAARGRELGRDGSEQVLQPQFEHLDQLSNAVCLELLGGSDDEGSE
jgi:hypothetical protein